MLGGVSQVGCALGEIEFLPRVRLLPLLSGGLHRRRHACTTQDILCIHTRHALRSPRQTSAISYYGSLCCLSWEETEM